MKDQAMFKGHIKWEIFNPVTKEWEFGGEDHNVTNIQYKQALAASLAGGSQPIANIMTAGTTNTSFTENSPDLTSPVGGTNQLILSSDGQTTQCIGTIYFPGSFTIRELGLWWNTVPIAFGNVNQTVTYISPIRVTWTVTNL